MQNFQERRLTDADVEAIVNALSKRQVSSCVFTEEEIFTLKEFIQSLKEIKKGSIRALVKTIVWFGLLALGYGVLVIIKSKM